MSSARAIVESRWAITNVVRPAITSRSAALIACSVEASTDEVASSRIRIRGSLSSARAIAIRWRWPPESVMPALADARVVARRGSSAMKPAACARSAARSTSARVASGPPVGDVLVHGRAEQERVVVDDADRVAQRGQVDLAHVGAVDPHRARGHVVEPREQLHQRRLARARSRRPGRPSSRPRRRGRCRAAPAPGAVSYPKVTSSSSTRPRPAGSGGAPGGAVSAGARSRIWNSRSPEAVARWARPSAMPSWRIGPISISRYV